MHQTMVSGHLAPGEQDPALKPNWFLENRGICEELLVHTSHQEVWWADTPIWSFSLQTWEVLSEETGGRVACFRLILLQSIRSSLCFDFLLSKCRPGCWPTRACLPGIWGWGTANMQGKTTAHSHLGQDRATSPWQPAPTICSDRQRLFRSQMTLYARWTLLAKERNPLRKRVNWGPNQSHTLSWWQSWD